MLVVLAAFFGYVHYTIIYLHHTIGLTIIGALAHLAALRTDAELNPLGDPVVWYCSPADDVLPHPMASLITGITPQEAKNKGLPETEFAQKILDEMSQPGTCNAGYNSIRFDDVITRNLLYRNLRDPYEREYRNGNSRWDLIDLARMCYALRPD